MKLTVDLFFSIPSIPASQILGSWDGWDRGFPVQLQKAELRRTVDAIPEEIIRAAKQASMHKPPER